jgi:RsmE family RNA methyltransferase
MNLLLLLPEAIADDGSVRLEPRQSRHLTGVLGVVPGQRLRAGCLDQSFGSAEVLSVEGGKVSVRYLPETPVGAAADRCLLLAVPRPKVLSRCLEHAAALGYTRIVLMRTRRVEKSQLDSHKLATDDMRRHLLLGLEQGQRVQLPLVSVEQRFKPFVEDRLDSVAGPANRLVAHPSAPQPLNELVPSGIGFTLAIGPEGGFIPYEVETLAEQGFQPVRAETGPLRVESAISYLTGQVDLLLCRRTVTSGC